MNFLDSVLNEPIFYSLSITLLHFLWQGLIIAAGLYLFLKLISNKHSALRYHGCLAAMSLCVIVPILTFLIVHQPELEVSSELKAIFSGANVQSIQESINATVTPSSLLELIPLLSIVWMAGVIFFSVSLLLEMLNVYQLARSSSVQPNAQLQRQFQQLASHLNIKKAAKLIISAKAEVPMVIGWLKPVVLVPLTMYSGLTSDQLEMLFAHELAHIKRNDYLVNFLQTLVEVVFFFHPSVKWISKQVREEREYCCDDIAIHHCGNAVAYATALTDAEMLRPHNIPQLAMAASGGNLKKRIFRAVGHNNCSPNFSGHWLASFFSFILISSILTASQVTGLPESSVEKVKELKQEVVDVAKPDVAKIDEKIDAVKPTLPEKKEIKSNLKQTTKQTIKNKPLKIELDSKQSDIKKEINEKNKKVDLISDTSKHFEEKPNKSIVQKAKSNKAAKISQAETKRKNNKQKNSAKENSVSNTVQTDVIPSSVPANTPALKTKVAAKPISLIAAETVKEPKLKVLPENNKKIKIAKLTAPKVEFELPKVEQAAVEEKFKLLKVSPKLIEGEIPYYPSEANRKKLSAEVKVTFEVTKRGRVRKISFHGDVHRAFRNSIKKELKNWRFEAGTLNGKSVSMKVTKVFNFASPSGERTKAIPNTGTRIKRV